MTVVFVATKPNNDISKEIDKFGKYQILQYILVCLPLVTVSMAHVNYVFVAEEVDHRCLVPQCESADPEVTTPLWWPAELDKRCYKPVLNQSTYENNNYVCSRNTFQDNFERCEEWVYANDNSIFSALNLGCQQWKTTMVGFMHNAGMIASMVFTGWIGDKFGRKPTIIICAMGGCIGALKIFIKNYYLYVTVEFLESLLESGLYTVGVVLLIEDGGESKRVLAGVIFSYAVYLGEVLFAILAMTLKFWKFLLLVVYTPMVFFLLYFFILRESIRWQMLRGRMNEVKSTLKRIVQMNKIDTTSEEIDAMTDEDIRSAFNVTLQKESEKFKDIIQSKEIMTRLAVTCVCFFTSSFLYYGLVVNSVLLPGNKYVNFILAALTAFPGDLIAYFAFHKLGRKISLQCAYILTAMFLIAQTYTPLSLSWLKVLLFLLGKVCVVMCFTGIYTYALELFPTSVRGSLFGFGNTVARIGGMLAPLTPLLVSTLNALPSILFASTAIISALLLTFTPETKTLPMFDTICQVENHHKKITTHL
ncbi:organic cation transporter protein [Amyelois transitella]|uniref:organic cation transporter protein n=1 Tax=Amyelois transitella TaxID=680683 RepID=UPI00067E0325|nr:organic cation transporter protein [Amyelois transitella]